MWLVEYWQAIDPQTLPHVRPSQVKSCMACRTNLRIAGSPTSNPPWLKAQSPELFSVLQLSHGNMGGENIP